MNLLFIGGGNMALALIGGLLDKQAGIRWLHVIEPNGEARKRLADQFSNAADAAGVNFTLDAKDCPQDFPSRDSDTWVVLAVKPQQMREACQQATANVKQTLTQANIFSIAAGISIAALARWCQNTKIVRAMPNTPALVGRGVTGLYAAASISAPARAQAERIMAAVGTVVWVAEEGLIDAVTALSGSGPAYVFRFLEALSEAGTGLGLDAKQASTLALETLKGAVALLESTSETPASLRQKVTSKGGTTAAALASLDQDQFMEIIKRALIAARDRGAEMSKEFL
jgi:pyrroline-5-carboxylate reductase